MPSLLEDLFNAVVAGKKEDVELVVGRALEAGNAAEELLNKGLIAPMAEVGDRFEKGEFFVPEMLVSARAMQAGLAILKPQLVEAGAKTADKVVIGTVKGDLHDIGKNLVAMMLEGAGFEVIDLGTDVPPEKFAAMARETEAKVIGLSALLTTTMQNMKSTIEAIEDLGIRGNIRIIIGGAPVTETFAQEIGADGYAPDASRAVKLAKSLLKS
jgi:5-methyltetrahydrofolate--homocysteine methyltransferase